MLISEMQSFETSYRYNKRSMHALFSLKKLSKAGLSDVENEIYLPSASSKANSIVLHVWITDTNDMYVI